MMQPKPTITLKQSEISSYPSVHHWLADKLSLPQHYGHNLDALWDCLTGELALPLSIVWVNDEPAAAPSDTADHGNIKLQAYGHSELVKQTDYHTFIAIFEEADDEVDGLSFQYIINNNA